MRFLILLFAAAAAAQQFDVASVKPAAPPEGPMGLMLLKLQDSTQNSMPIGRLPLKGAKLSIQARTLRSLIATAYRIRPADVEGPDWIGELVFTVEARLPSGAPAEQANAMLQTLLEERFALKAHREERTLAGFALTLAKDGPKLKPAAPPGQPADPEERRKRMMGRMKSGSFQASWGSSDATSAQIASAISNMVHAPVADETGLEGHYEVDFEVARGETPDENIDHLVALAISELGLKLEARRKTTVTRLIVDSALKTPTEN